MNKENSDLDSVIDLNTRVDDADISTRLRNILGRRELYTFADVIAYGEKRFRMVRNLGEKTFNELSNYLLDNGLIERPWNFNESESDAEPIEHGRWKASNKWLMLYCSNCNFEIGGVLAAKYKYCPNCGATMDGEEQ